MIELILKSYFSILFAISASCFSILFLGLYFIFKRNLTNDATSSAVSASDITAIAGDDLFSTQLDLARAFIESGKRQFAKTILDTIAEDGNKDQQAEAKLLLAKL